MGRLVLAAVVVVLMRVPVVAMAAELPRAEPGEVGLSAAKLAELTPELQKLVDQGKMPGGVVLVARHGKVVHLAAFGYRDLASKTPMTDDTIFAIASMTKPITCIALMTLVEEGKIGLDDPVSKYLPELAGLRVLGDAKDDTPTEIATVPAKRPVTIRDLLSHTSGFAYGGFLSFDVRLGRSYTRARVQEAGMKTIAEQVERLAKVPLAHQPGDGWTYGLSHDVLGRVIEVVSGQSFDAFLKERIFTPLDLRDTSFLVPESKRDRVATIYRGGLLGSLNPLPRNFGSATFFSGGGGLLSTARDYSRFAQMLASRGELGGVRIVKPETIALMTTNQIGDRKALGLFQYGLGFGLEMTPGRDGGKPVLNRYFWGGLFSTNFWVDPRHDLVALVMTQVVPTNLDGSIRVLRQTVDGAIEK
jgi:CubicO group peptidase (beta-lactamase class C family)